jgi:hypothetical protein
MPNSRKSNLMVLKLIVLDEKGSHSLNIAVILEHYGYPKLTTVNKCWQDANVKQDLAIAEELLNNY